MKTLEFKLHPSTSQSQIIDLWLRQLKWVWNRGLSLLEEHQQRRWRQKHNHSLPDSLRLKWKNNHFIGCGVQKTKGGHKYCKIRTDRSIEDPKKLFVSGSYYAKQYNQDKPWLQGICTRVMSGIHQSLDKAWKTYSDPSHPGRRPHYKGKRDNLKTLINNNGRTTVKFTHVDKSDDAFVQFPVLGKITCKGFYKRYPVGVEHGSVKIVKEPSGYYLQVCVDLPEKQLKQSDRLVGIDPGLKSVLTTDQGREVAPPRLYRKREKKIQRLQRKASRQQEGSTSQKRTRQKIALENEKIRRSRNAFNHKLSTKIVREYGAIAIENIQIKNLVRRPKAKKRKDGKGYEQNGAKRKSGLNKSFADNALGDLIAKIESKCKVAGRDFMRVPAAYTTINCSRCGEKVAKALSTRTHRCPSCGYVDGRDSNAAKNILAKGRQILLEDFGKHYRAWAWEWDENPKRDESDRPTGGTTDVIASETPLSSNGGVPPEAVLETALQPRDEDSLQQLLCL